jgi:hypothetical protein
MKQKTLVWVALFVVLALVSGGIYLFAGHQGTLAAIYIDGELYDTIDLAAVVVPYERTVETADGYNTLLVSHGSIAVKEADCPGQDCVHQGSISDGLIPIVCLPHRIVIQIEDGT